MPFTNELTFAKTAYESGNLSVAHDLTSKIITLHLRPEYFACSSKELLLDLITLIFDVDADFYYALHAFDACEAMAKHAFLTEANTYKTTALTILHTKYGDSPYLSFMEAICDAKIAFSMEDYYGCIDAATTANALWYPSENEQVSMPYCPNEEAAFHAIEQAGINNVLLLLYEKYKKTDFFNYSELTAALSSIAYIFEKEPSDFTQTINAASYCYSQNMFTISRYNYALSSISVGNYSKALSEFQAAGKTGYSLQLAILAHENRTTDIEALRNTVDSYFYRQINQIVSHYHEELAYNHLARLQYHIDLTLGAYCHKELDSENAYDFLLNTKYIALETSFLGNARQERTLYTSAQIMNCLKTNTILLEYTCIRTITGVHYGVFVVSENKVSYVSLGDAEYIDTLIKGCYPYQYPAGII